MRNNQIGDLTGVTGLGITLSGFAAIMAGVHKSKTAAERAELASGSTRQSIRRFETVVDCGGVIAMLEDVKRSPRQGQWSLMLDRHAAIRKVLLTLKGANVELTAKQRSGIHVALTNISGIGETVEAGLSDPESLRPDQFNRIVSQDIDRLQAMLVGMKVARAGGRL